MNEDKEHQPNLTDSTEHETAPEPLFATPTPDEISDSEDLEAEGPTGQQVIGPTIDWSGSPTTTQYRSFFLIGVWSENVGTSFTQDDINFSGGVSIRQQTFSYSPTLLGVPGREFRAEIVLPSSGSGNIIVTVPANSVTPSNTLQSITIPYAQPIEITLTGPSGTQTGPFTVSGIFSQNIGTSFTQRDIYINHGIITNFTYDSMLSDEAGRRFSFTVNPLPPTGRTFRSIGGMRRHEIQIDVTVLDYVRFVHRSNFLRIPYELPTPTIISNIPSKGIREGIQIVSLTFSGPGTTDVRLTGGTTPIGTFHNTLNVTGIWSRHVTNFTLNDIIILNRNNETPTNLSIGNFAYDPTLSGEAGRTFSFTITPDNDIYLDDFFSLIIHRDSVAPFNYRFNAHFHIRTTQRVIWSRSLSFERRSGTFEVRGFWVRNVGTSFTQNDIIVYRETIVQNQRVRSRISATITNFTYDSTLSGEAGRRFSFNITPNISSSQDILIVIEGNSVTPVAIGESIVEYRYQPEPFATQLSASTGTLDVVGLWSNNVTGFEQTDLTITQGSGTITNFAYNPTLSGEAGRRFSFTITPDLPISRSLINATITIPQRSVSPSNTISTLRASYIPPRISWGAPTTTQTSIFRVSGSWNKTPIGFTESDINVSAGSVVYTSIRGRGFDIFIEPPNTGSGTITISIPANSVTFTNELVTTNFSESVTVNYVATSLSNVSWTLPDNYQYLDSVTITGVWSVNVGTSFTQDDITSSATNINDFIYDPTLPGEAGRTFRVTLLIPTFSTLGTLTIPANSVTPSNTAQVLDLVTAESTRIEWDAPVTRQTNAFTIEGTFRRSGGTSSSIPNILTTNFVNVGTSFTQDDIEFIQGSGTITNFVYDPTLSGEAGSKFSFTVTPPSTGSGYLIIGLAAGAVDPYNIADAVEIPYGSSTAVSISANTPTIDVDLGTIAYILTWFNISAIADINFDIADIIDNLRYTGTTGAGLPRQNSILSVPSNSKAIYGYVVYPETGEAGTLSLSVASNIYLNNPAYTSPTTNFDMEATLSNHPSATFEVPTGIQTGATFNIIVDFGETLSSTNPLDTRASQSNTDLDISGATGASFATITALTTRQRYQVTITPPTNQQGYLALVLLKDVVTNSRNLIGPVVGQYSPSVYYDTRAAITSAGFTLGNAENMAGTTLTTIQDTFYVDITASKSVTGFTQNDLVVTNACIASFTGSGDTYRISLTPSIEESDVITLLIPANIVTSSGGNNAVTKRYDLAAPTRPDVENIDWPDEIPSGAGTWFLDVDFNVAVTDFATTDIILDAPSSTSITSITWGTTSIASQSDRTMRTRSSTLATVGTAGKQYYRINFTNTSAYEGETINAIIKDGAVQGPNPVNS